MSIARQLQDLTNNLFTLPHTTAQERDAQAQVPSHEEQVRFYREWLAARYAAGTKERNIQAAEAYAQTVDNEVVVGDRVHTPYARFRPEVSAYKVITTPQRYVLIAFFALLGLLLLLDFYTVITAVVAAITLFYFVSLFVNFALTFKSVTTPEHIYVEASIVHDLADAHWPHYTILCPLYKEEESAPQLVQALSEMDYPADKLQVLIMLESDDVGTLAVLQSLHLPDFIELVILPEGTPRTKPRSCNYGLTMATGDYVVIYDAEDIPDPLQLKKAVLAFAQSDDNLACVQAKLNFYNADQNALTRWFTIEYATWYEMVMPSMRWAHLSIPLGGTSNHFRTDILRGLGAWDAFNVTEDCDLGMRLEHDGYYTTVLDSTTYEEANSQLANWLTQRTRWIKGFLITYMVYMRNPLQYWHPSRWAEFISLQLVIGGRTLVVLLNPILWGLMLGYILFGAQAQDFYNSIFPRPVFYMGLITLIFGNLLYIYTHMLGAARLRRYNLVRWAVVMPVYWVLHSVAGYKALWNYIFAPHFWEKTKHGLHHGSDENEVPEYDLEPGVVAAPRKRLYDAIDLAQEARYQAAAAGSSAWAWLRDPALLTTLTVAIVAAGVALVSALNANLITASNEAAMHLAIARRLIDSATPGLGQLSYQHLPLFHLLMAPFAANDTLFATGLAGSIISGLSYIAAVGFLYLIIKMVTHSQWTSILGALLFALNPNVLYLQAVPLSTMLIIATLLGASYYLLRWINDDNPRTIIALAIATFVATVAGYSGWLFFVLAFFIVAYVSEKRGYSASHNESNLLFFGVIGGLGIVLWFAWNALILSVPRVAFDATMLAQEGALLANPALLPTSQNFFNSVRVLYHAVAGIASPLWVGLALIGFGFAVRGLRSLWMTLGVLSILVPTVAVLLALFTGQMVLYVPQIAPEGAPTNLLNVEMAVYALVPIALFSAIALYSFYRFADDMADRHIVKYAVVAVPAVLMMAHGIWAVATHNVLVVNEAQSDFVAMDDAPIAEHMAVHYDDGIIWISTPQEMAYQLVRTPNINHADLIHEGNAADWEALVNGEVMADWIIVSTADTGDNVFKALAEFDTAYLANYERVVEEPDGDVLYQRR